MPTKEQLRAKNCPENCCDAVQRALQAGIPWEQIIQALSQFGNMIWQILNVLFPPAPKPATDEKTKEGDSGHEEGKAKD